MKLQSKKNILRRLMALTALLALIPMTDFATTPSYSFTDDAGVISLSSDLALIMNDYFSSPYSSGGPNSMQIDIILAPGYLPTTTFSGYAESGEADGGVDTFAANFDSDSLLFRTDIPSSPYPEISNGEIVDYISHNGVNTPLYFYITAPSVPDNACSSLILFSGALVSLFGISRLKLFRDARGTR